MRILWLCNIVLLELTEEFGFRRKVSVGGWLTGMWAELKKEPNITLGICVPIINEERMKDGLYQGYNYYSFQLCDEEDNEKQVRRFGDILKDFKPDIIHIWGTEYNHSYNMLLACKKMELLNRVVVNIQGLVTYYKKVFQLGIPDIDYHKEIEGKAISDGQKEFEKNSITEIDTLKNVKHVIGRTDWDRACVYDINPACKYHYCGEIMRPEFYEPVGTRDFVDHRILISQASYPIKGLHNVLEQLGKLRDDYADLSIHIAGTNLYEADIPYAQYIKNLIRKYDMEKCILFVGMLDASNMKREYNEAQVFLSCSNIENSSNSICEAMLAGTPVVASYVGGTGSFVKHGETGLLYPVNEPQIMYLYIRKLFNDDELAATISVEARKEISDFVDKDKNRERLISIYNGILKAE